MNHTEYMRLYRAKDPERQRAYSRSLRARPLLPEHMVEAARRFWPKTRPEGECLIFTGQIGRSGYGFFNVRQRKVLAHRFAFEDTWGPIPDGLTLDHLCRNRACVNPTHLEPVTMRENTLRGMSPSAVTWRARNPL